MKLYTSLLTGSHRRQPNENIHIYAAQTLEIKRDLKQNNMSIPNETIHYNFLQGLGPEFLKIRRDLEVRCLHPDWCTHDINALIPIVTKYLHVNQNLQEFDDMATISSTPSTKTPTNNISSPTPNTSTSTQSTSTTKSDPQTPDQRTQDTRRKGRIMAAIFNGTFNASDYVSEIPHGKYILHGEYSSDPTFPSGDRPGCANIRRYQQEARRQQQQNTSSTTISTTPSTRTYPPPMNNPTSPSPPTNHPSPSTIPPQQTNTTTNNTISQPTTCATTAPTAPPNIDTNVTQDNASIDNQISTLTKFTNDINNNNSLTHVFCV